MSREPSVTPADIPLDFKIFVIRNPITKRLDWEFSSTFHDKYTEISLNEYYKNSQVFEAILWDGSNLEDIKNFFWNSSLLDLKFSVIDEELPLLIATYISFPYLQKKVSSYKDPVYLTTGGYSIISFTEDSSFIKISN